MGPAARRRKAAAAAAGLLGYDDGSPGIVEKKHLSAAAARLRVAELHAKARCDSVGCAVDDGAAEDKEEDDGDDKLWLQAMEVILSRPINESPHAAKLAPYLLLGGETSASDAFHGK